MDVPTLTRSWPPLAGVGAGLVLFALCAVLAQGAPSATPVITAAALGVFGAAALGWSAASFVAGRPVTPRAAVAASLTGLGVLAAAFAATPDRVSFAAVTAGGILLLLVSVAGAVAWRAASRASALAVPGRASVAGVIVGAVAVTALVLPAIGAAQTLDDPLTPRPGMEESPGHEH